MSVTSIDNKMSHLFPAFRVKVEAVLKETKDHLGEEWLLVEGFRSQARQDYLYAQGRTRPGPKVTWIKTTRWHGAGMAADLMPSKSGYHAPHDWWELMQHIARGHGLSDPAWAKGDLGHVQLTDEVIRKQALVWVKNGFKEG